MFNRKLEIGMVKGKKTQTEENAQPERTLEDKAKIIGKVVEKTLVRVAILVVAVIAADTVRQVVVESAKD